MHNRPGFSVPPAWRRLSAGTETGGAQTWAVPAGVARVAFPLCGAHDDAVAWVGGCVLIRAGGVAAEVAATLPVTSGTGLQAHDGQAGGAAATGPAGDGGASGVRPPASSGTCPLANRLLAAGAGGNAASPRRTGRSARDGGGTLGNGAGRGASLAEREYAGARFGGVPVLVAPELAARIRAFREEQP